MKMSTMNQTLVNKLAKKSGFRTSSHSGHLCVNDKDNRCGVCQHEVEKLIRLVVDECARLADQGFGSDHFGQGITGDTLKDYFGIKN